MARTRAKTRALRKKRHTGLLILFLLLCISLALAVAAVFKVQKMFTREMDLVDTIQKVDAPVPLYTLDIDGDYYFDEFITEHRGASTDKEVADFLTDRISHGFYKYADKLPGAVSSGAMLRGDMHTACAVISAQDKDGNHVWARNYDWGHPVTVIVRSRPDNGYASISTCDFTNITSGTDALESENAFDRFIALSAYYVPLDGINEAGLCVADLEINEGGMTETFTDKPDLTITTAIRLILNKTATVDEAVAMLGQFDIHPSGCISHHLAISDASGKSVVLEFLEGRVEVVDRHYVTNFTLFYDDTLSGGENAQYRYNVLRQTYKDYEGVLSLDRTRQTVIEAAQTEGDYLTRWTIVYGGPEKTLNYYFDRDWEHPYAFGPDF